MSSESERIVWYALGGNGLIAGVKFAAAVHSGSSAMYAEAVHSAVDCANQGLLLVGLRAATTAADVAHPYGYGKSVYFWSLVSALGTFWLGAGVTVASSAGELSAPSINLDASWEVFSVLGVSFAIDGYVFSRSLRHLYETKPRGKPFLSHVASFRDPTVLAVLLEDGAACLGVLVAAGGVFAASSTGLHVLDAVSGVLVGVLLGGVGATLAAVNGRYLIGTAVEPETVREIDRLIRSRPSVEALHSVQSMWVGPNAFSYKCEVEFDGTWIAARLYDRYKPRFSDPSEFKVLLSFYAEDVLRTVETEVKNIETAVRAEHPAALFIEIEPDAGTIEDEGFAIDERYFDAEAKKHEGEVLDGFLEAARRQEDYLLKRRGFLDDDDYPAQ
ncbi:hypothetical protein CTAYLR_005806 [Chrysophaeum taylorii]|uniref:Cation efflux protein transmembrane domain-containing protein n=1 Tax=Chrysophaeum taylorii TaxID=2483200 RepID=A0AAD7UN67_9STRA|nr:hypothetical protein CTAYLR_005806 [Chrysophaeum taylorii]